MIDEIGIAISGKISSIKEYNFEKLTTMAIAKKIALFCDLDHWISRWSTIVLRSFDQMHKAPFIFFKGLLCKLDKILLKYRIPSDKGRSPKYCYSKRIGITLSSLLSKAWPIADRAIGDLSDDLYFAIARWSPIFILKNDRKVIAIAKFDDRAISS